MSRDLDLRITDLKKVVTAFEAERDKLLDQVQYLKGSADRIEWVIKVMVGQLEWIEKDEKNKEALVKKEEASILVAKEKGNIGAHPTYSQKSAELADRKDKILPSPDQQDSQLVEKKKK